MQGVRSHPALLVVAVVLVANAPMLLGIVEANPIGPRTGLLNTLTPGPLPGAPSIDPSNGFVAQALGHRAALDLLAFHLPWWNPLEGTGAPLAGGMQSGAFFAPTLLMALPNGLLYENVLLELVAGLSLYLLLRRLSLHPAACVAGAIAFALNGTFVWIAQPPTRAVALIPLVLLGIEVAFGRSMDGQRGGWWLLALAGAGLVYAGHPELAYLGGLFALSWFAWRCGCARGASRLAFVRKAGAGTAVALLLAAPLLIAFADYLSEADVGGRAGGVSGLVHLPHEALPQLLLPYVFGPVFGFGDPQLTLPTIWDEVGGFLSMSLLVLALLGLGARGRRGLRLLLLIWIVLALPRIYGHPHLLHSLLGLPPGMSNVAFYRYGFVLVELATIVLAAVGMDELARRRLSAQRAAIVLTISLAVVAVAAIVAHPLARRLGSAFFRYPYFAGSVAWAVAIAVAVVGVAFLADAPRRAWLAAALVAGEAVVLFMLPQGSAPRRVQLDRPPVAFLSQHLGDARFFTLGPLQPNYGSYFGLGELDINDLPIPTAFADYIHTRLDPVVSPPFFVGNLGGFRPPSAPSPEQELLGNLPGYRAAGVRYVLAPPGTTLPHPAFELVFRSPSTWIFRLTGAARYFSATSPACAVRPKGREEVRVSCRSAARVVRLETAMDGWSARLDGHLVPIRRVAGLFQAVQVPAGSHRVVFSYAPPHIEWGYAAFALGCLSCLLLVRRPELV